MHYAIVELVSAWKLAIVLLIVLVIFGPARLPQIGRQLGAGMREFKSSLTGKDKDDDEDGDEEIAVNMAALPAPDSDQSPNEQIRVGKSLGQTPSQQALIGNGDHPLSREAPAGNVDHTLSEQTQPGNKIVL